jgi:hypothetical protein
MLVSNYLAKRSLAMPIQFAVATICKTALLFSGAFVLYHLHLIPVIFLTVMGVVQLITAGVGGVLAYVGIKSKVVKM